ncbi:Hypothetical predicted protein, partial [Paramuricea clavata]
NGGQFRKAVFQRQTSRIQEWHKTTEYNYKDQWSVTKAQTIQHQARGEYQKCALLWVRAVDLEVDSSDGYIPSRLQHRGGVCERSCYRVRIKSR